MSDDPDNDYDRIRQVGKGNPQDWRSQPDRAFLDRRGERVPVHEMESWLAEFARRFGCNEGKKAK